ncbi:MAG: hypothetical protein JW388_0811 [Nitrospira sp.]|nr:hypothetical protein [Nitrospira sp.]
MQALADIVSPQKMQYATTEFVDIAVLEVFSVGARWNSSRFDGSMSI